MALPMWAAILGVAAAAAVVLMCLPADFRVRFAFRGPGRGERVVFEIAALGGLSLWRVAVPLTDLVPGRVRRGFEAIVGRATRARLTLPEARSLGVTVADVVVRLARQARWARLDWITTVGFQDAAATALTAGGLWVLKGNLAALARRRLRLAPGLPRIDVRPDFAGGGLESKLDGIGVLRVGHIIFALAGLALAYYHLWRGGRNEATGRRTNPPGRRSGWPSTPFKA